VAGLEGLETSKDSLIVPGSTTHQRARTVSLEQALNMAVARLPGSATVMACIREERP
jgi:hypothetical protein